jgi:hypothetical protein
VGLRAGLDAVAKVISCPAGKSSTCSAVVLVCGGPVSCFAAGQNAGRVTHEPDRASLLFSLARSLQRGDRARLLKCLLP